MNISSIVIRCTPEHYDEIKKWCEESGVCEYHFGDKPTGKIIVTIEAEDVNGEIAKLMEIQRVDHVISAEMMMTYQEDLDAAMKELDEAEEVPELLQRCTEEEIDPATVVYHGDLKKKL
ncbi:chaperone NapD [Nitratifractor salsuginis]|uniref:Chaperone NapD n=1 Tax=Nitratifractor salsuginis (strain DSM 16511 / JCM 12458 / E9I37-1) TaxID=749222 RepID=E6X0J9_NITSE|nr:chaperone NapD [Nitratifractor salsuginis]ADV46849.1 NapD family protein [Nitratifractor salsuginis DSM 16511]